MSLGELPRKFGTARDLLTRGERVRLVDAKRGVIAGYLVGPDQPEGFDAVADLIRQGGTRTFTCSACGGGRPPPTSAAGCQAAA